MRGSESYRRSSTNNFIDLWRSLVARHSDKVKVGGSNPPRSTILIFSLLLSVEHRTCTSSLFYRTKLNYTLAILLLTPNIDIVVMVNQKRSRHASEIQRLLVAGVSGTDIVRELQCSKTTVSYHRGKLGLRQPAKDYDWNAIQTFLGSGHSVKECLTQFGVSGPTVYKARQNGRITFPARILKPSRVTPLSSKKLNTPGRVGDISELEVASSLLQSDLLVLRPIGNNSRYDLVFESPLGRLYKVQVKTGRLSKGVVIIKTESTTGDRHRALQTYEGEVDYIGAYCPANDKTYLVPMSVTGSLRALYLRIGKPRNGQTTGIRWAEHYILSDVVRQL